MHGPNDGFDVSRLTDFQRDILFASFLLGKTYSTKEYEAELPKAIARILIKIAADTKHRGHAYFLVMVAQLFDPEISTHQFAGYPEPFIRAARRKVRLVMTTKGHPKDHHIDDEAVPRTARGTLKAEAIAQLLGVGERQAYRIKAGVKAGEKRGRKRN
jgi:hypothetical protein